MSTETWGPDPLGEPYQSRTLTLRPDFEGEVVTTLVRRLRDPGTDLRGAVLHVHGFADYFFQVPAADWWCSQGYDFYAVDLRKYGRSLRPHQTPTFIEDLGTYREELDAAVAEIGTDYPRLIVSGHSTGGLTVPLWVADAKPPVDALFLNAPWLAQSNALSHKVALPVFDQIARVRPLQEVPRNVDGVYTKSLHRNFSGEWDFDLAWKPVESFPVRAGFLRAVRLGQARVAAGLGLEIPILVITPARSSHATSPDHPDAHATDLVLDVERIRAVVGCLGHRVTSVAIEGARHEVTLSRLPARQQVFAEIDRFLTAWLD